MNTIRSVVLGFATAVLWTISLQAESRIWWDCTINGKPVRLAFDTGATHAILFKKTADRLGLKHFPPEDTKTPVSPGMVRGGLTEECEFMMSGHSYQMQFAVYDLPGYLRTGADGLVGWGAFRNNIFWIDARKDELDIFAKVPEKAKAWKQFHLKADADIVTLEVPGKTHTNTIVLDTGSEVGIWLSPEKWRAWKANHPTQRFTLNASFLPATGLFVREEAWADKIVVGPLVFTDVPICEAHSSFASSQTTLGLTAMKQFQIVVDGEQGIAYVNVTSQKPQPYEHNRLGAVFAPNDPNKDDDLIAHVAPGSPAQKAGIQNGDILLKIGELDVTKWRTDPGVLPLSRFFTQPKGTKLSLKLQRDERMIEINPILEDILGPKLSSQNGEAAGKGEKDK